MPYVKCPSCGERGKIGQALVGARIKCKRCGVGFQVVAPTKATAGLTTGFATPAGDRPDGIEVEGLDASAWGVATDVGGDLKAVATAEPSAQGEPAAFVADATEPQGRQYKVLTPKDKYFDGKFDLARLEEALNHFGRQGWTVKSMSTPHVKNFTGALEETIVVLLER
jgi:hypothetical protein